MIEALDDDDVLVRISAAESLGDIVSRTNQGLEAVVVALTRALKDRRATVAATAAQSLRKLGEGDLAIVPGYAPKLEK